MPSSDLVLNVRQIGNYTPVTNTGPSDLVLIQQGGIGGPYANISPSYLVSTALNNTTLGMAVSGELQVGSLTSGQLVATNVTLQTLDSQTAVIGQLQIAGGSMGGVPIATANDIAATKAYADVGDANLESVIANYRTLSVISFNQRVGNIVLTLGDIIQAGGAPLCNPMFCGAPTSPTPPPGDNSMAIATTAFVAASLTTAAVSSFNGRVGAVTLTDADLVAANVSLAPLASPNFSGAPSAPTAAPGTSDGQLATTAFVMAAVASSTAGVATWNGRTGAVVMTAADVTAAGGASLSSPAFLGTPTAPLAATNANTAQIATCAWVMNQLGLLGAGVASFNGRTGAVVQVLADITGAGGAPIASPTFTGAPAGPSPMAGDNSTRLATTAWVIANSVATFNGRMGTVTLTANDVSGAGGALLASPGFTGVPTAPTAAPGTSSLQLATTAFVGAAISAIGATVTSWNGRTGAVTLSSADLTAAGGALLASPTFTGVPAAPTAAPGTNTTQLATTQFVTAALAASVTGVASFNTRTGAVVLTAADITGAGGALLAGPAFTGVPTAPTAVAGTNTVQIATTQFVTAAIAAINPGVASFNTRTGAVVLTNTDVLNVLPASTTAPLMSGTASAGSAAGWSRGDHVHPVDTSRLAVAGGTVTGALTVTGLLKTGSPAWTGLTPSANDISVAGVVYATSAAFQEASGNPLALFYDNGGVQRGQVGYNATSGSVFMYNAAGSNTLSIATDSSLNYTNNVTYKPSGGAWQATSDARIKTVKGDYVGGLDEVVALKPIRYAYKGNDAGPDTPSPHAEVTGQEFVGLIAQEVEAILPGMVTKTDGYVDGAKVDDLRRLDTSELVFALVNAVKTLAERVKVLEDAT